MYRKLLIFVFFIVSLVVFLVSSRVNYAQHVSFKHAFVDHPEFIPSAVSVRLASGGFENAISDTYWLSAIQYIGTNAIGAEYKEYLYVMLELITDLNPHFTYPYEIGELLLSSYNERYEGYSDEQIEKHTDQSFALGLKWIRNNCDVSKVEAIKKELDIGKLWTEQRYKNPCSDPMIPYYLAYIAYWSQKDAKTASEYYRVTAANEDAPTGARTMAAIMQGKTGNREKAIVMFLSLAQNIGGQKQSDCRDASKELGTILTDAFSRQIELNGRFLQWVDTVRHAVVKKLDEEWIDPSKTADVERYCSTYLNKAVREMNLSYIEWADARYFADKKLHAETPKQLYSAGYIDYVPRDFQEFKSSNEQQRIVYYYNAEIGAWDYKMDYEN